MKQNWLIKKKKKNSNKVLEGKKEFDSKRPNLQAEILKKAQEHEKILEGKKEFDAKKPEMFKEIQQKVEGKK